MNGFRMKLVAEVRDPRARHVVCHPEQSEGSVLGGAKDLPPSKAKDLVVSRVPSSTAGKAEADESLRVPRSLEKETGGEVGQEALQPDREALQLFQVLACRSGRVQRVEPLHVPLELPE